MEQPMSKGAPDDNAWLTERSPVIGDEGVQRLSDPGRAIGVYASINVKRMKATGTREARRMIVTGRRSG
jgi:hypothetical protein